MDEIRMTILGDCPSKANAYKIITIGGHASLSKTQSLKAYEKSFFLQCPHRDAYITTFFKIDIDVYYQNNRKEYLTQIVHNLLNWDFASQNYKKN